jgi:hypothetical protein
MLCSSSKVGRPAGGKYRLYHLGEIRNHSREQSPHNPLPFYGICSGVRTANFSEKCVRCEVFTAVTVKNAVSGV